MHGVQKTFADMQKDFSSVRGYIDLVCKRFFPSGYITSSMIPKPAGHKPNLLLMKCFVTI